MTCVSPKTIVDKFIELAHGDAGSEDRRVVLDGSMKDDVNDVLVCNGDDLLERFLSHVSDAPKQVKNTHQPILILVFGHGVEDTYSIIGGTGSFETCPKLTRPKLNEVLFRHNPDPNVAMLISSCFGEGWIQTSYLNITAMAGVEESTNSYHGLKVGQRAVAVIQDTRQALPKLSSKWKFEALIC